MAAATGVAVVSLFAATDPAVFRPYGHRVKVLTASNMSDIPPSEVLEAVTMLMSEPSDRIS
jgi:ADP-heptose:LPS heptosyltransferase